MRLDDWMTANSVTNASFAGDIGVTEMTVSRYRRGRMPKTAIAERIRRRTNGHVTVADLHAAAVEAEQAVTA